MQNPIIVWFRQDLRLSDHPALDHAYRLDKSVLPCYVIDNRRENIAPGRASNWWLFHSLKELNDKFLDKGGSLCIRQGDPVKIITELAIESNAHAVFWLNSIEPECRRQEKRLRSLLQKNDIKCVGFDGNFLFKPGSILNNSELPFRVFTPFWKRCIKDKNSIRKPSGNAKISFYNHIPGGITFKKLFTLLADQPWTSGLENIWKPGEDAGKLIRNELMHQLSGYDFNRDIPSLDATSRLSPYLHFGNVSVAQVFQDISPLDRDNTDYASFRRELGWREFNAHLIFHFPSFCDGPFKQEFNNFPWTNDQELLKKWQKGRTGFPIVDAGMRQLWNTGWMHNRVRMITASLLVKHLLVDWKFGRDWFWDTLVDADLSNNSAGWQWVAGCGSDAAPYFRIFNPILQGKKFDPQGLFVRRWIPEINKLPNRFIHDPWNAPPVFLQEAGVRLGDNYPYPIVDLNDGRKKALAAFKKTNSHKKLA